MVIAKEVLYCDQCDQILEKNDINFWSCYRCRGIDNTHCRKCTPPFFLNEINDRTYCKMHRDKIARQKQKEERNGFFIHIIECENCKNQWYGDESVLDEVPECENCGEHLCDECCLDDASTLCNDCYLESENK